MIYDIIDHVKWSFWVKNFEMNREIIKMKPFCPFQTNDDDLADLFESCDDHVWSRMVKTNQFRHPNMKKFASKFAFSHQNDLFSTLMCRNRLMLTDIVLLLWSKLPFSLENATNRCILYDIDVLNSPPYTYLPVHTHWPSQSWAWRHVLGH